MSKLAVQFLLGLAFSLFGMLSYGYELTIKNHETALHLSQEQLKDLTQETLKTITPWTNEPEVYSGISLSSLIAHYQIQATKVRAKALNDYQVEIDLQQAINSGAFIASHAEGQPMKLRNKGPFWIVFPWSKYPHLIERKYQDWSIWQLTELSFY